jgi:hypothetical protein
MTKVFKLNTIEKGDDFINIISDKELLVYEDIQGSRIFVRYDGQRFIIKPKNLRNDPLNFIDLAIQKFYNPAYYYFNSLPQYITDLLNPNWWFCFEYFPDLHPANIEYSKTPKNGLILVCIVKGQKYKYNYDELKEFAALMDVDSLPVIFKGKLSKKQLEIIALFLNSSDEDLKYVFGENNFAKFFYELLNPNFKNSFLMIDDEFNNNLEKIIMKIDGNDEYSFELLNPLYKRMSFTNDTNYVEIYSQILLNFLEFCQLIDIKKFKVKANTKDEIYIELISQIFNEYIENIKDSIDKWTIVIPDFFKDEKFKLNTDMLLNKKTIEHAKSSKKIEYMLKVILSSFNHKKKRSFGVFNEQTVILFNEFVDKISNYIDKLLNINREYNLQKNDLMNFNDYFKLKFNVDTDGKLYPDVYDKEKQPKEEEGEGKKDVKKGVIKKGVEKK